MTRTLLVIVLVLAAASAVPPVAHAYDCDWSGKDDFCRGWDTCQCIDVAAPLSATGLEVESEWKPQTTAPQFKTGAVTGTNCRHCFSTGICIRTPNEHKLCTATRNAFTDYITAETDGGNSIDNA